jgi:hypothetical protein
MLSVILLGSVRHGVGTDPAVATLVTTASGGSSLLRPNSSVNDFIQTTLQKRLSQFEKKDPMGQVSEATLARRSESCLEDQPAMVRPRQSELSLVRPQQSELSLVRPQQGQSPLVRPHQEEIAVFRPQQDESRLVRPQQDNHSLIGTNSDRSEVEVVALTGNKSVRGEPLVIDFKGDSSLQKEPAVITSSGDKLKRVECVHMYPDEVKK